MLTMYFSDFATIRVWTQNFLFRHWVMNHCCMKPYLCAYCGLKSPTRDGITRHQTSKHKGHPRRVCIQLKYSEFKQLTSLTTTHEHMMHAQAHFG